MTLMHNTTHAKTLTLFAVTLLTMLATASCSGETAPKKKQAVEVGPGGKRGDNKKLGGANKFKGNADLDEVESLAQYLRSVLPFSEHLAEPKACAQMDALRKKCVRIFIAIEKAEQEGDKKSAQRLSEDLKKQALKLGVNLNDDEYAENREYMQRPMNAAISRAKMSASDSEFAEYLRIIRLLVKAGANVNKMESDYLGNSPLRDAINHSLGTTNREEDERAVALVKFLIKEGVKLNNVVDSDHSRCPHEIIPLHLAAEQGLIEIAAVLIKAGADINAKNRYGQTAMDLATKPSMEKLLKAAAKK